MNELNIFDESRTLFTEDNDGNPIVVKFGLSFTFEPGELYEGDTLEEIDEAYRREVEALDKEFEKYMIKDEEGEDDEADGFAE